TAGAAPTPLNATDCEGMVPAKVIASVPVRCPVAVGVNTTLISHFCPAGILPLQLSVSEKSPLMETPGDIGASPKLLSITSLGVLGTLTFSEPKETWLGILNGTGAPIWEQSSRESRESRRYRELQV